MDEEQKKILDAIEVKLGEAVKQYEGQLKENGEASEKARAEVKALAAEHEALVKSMPELKNRIKEVEQLLATGKISHKEAPKTWGQSFADSEQFKNFKGGAGTKARIEVKNTLLGEAGSPQEPSDTIIPSQRLPGVVPGAYRALNILDFVNTGSTGSNQIEYTREASWTNDAAETAEGAQKPESDLTFELISDPVRTIAHFIKASKQILDDAPMLASYIDSRMTHGVRNRLQLQILRGTGVSPLISGLSASGRHTAFTPESGENSFDAISRAKYAVIAADYQPNFVFLNPADWGAMERLKRNSTDATYMAGEGAALAYINNGLTPVIWGLPVVPSNDVASGYFYLGDSSAFQLFMRQGVAIEMFEQDDTNVQKNLITIRAELRAALASFTPTAIRYGSLVV